MRFRFPILLALLFSVRLYSQNIYAGQHGQYDHYLDIPDTSLYVPGIMVNDSAVYDVDVNGDMISDLRFGSTYNNQGNWSNERRLWARPSGNNQVCIFGFDSCFGADSLQTFAYRELMANPFAANQVIDNSYSWKDTTVVLMRNGWNCCTPTPVGYNCMMNTFTSSASFLGIRVIQSTDTFYGWVKLRASNGPYSDSLIVDSWACQISLAGISQSAQQAASAFYDAPGKQLKLHLSQTISDESTLRVFDSTGRIVSEAIVPHSSASFTLSLANLPPGVYSWQMVSGKGNGSGKFLVTTE